MPSEEILSAATAIARAAEYALRSAPDIPEGLTVEVADGHVTLRGEAAWEYEREAAERAVRAAAGVRAITNLIRLPARSADRTAAAPSPAAHPRGRLSARPRSSSA
jgi:BON domain